MPGLVAAPRPRQRRTPASPTFPAADPRGRTSWSTSLFSEVTLQVPSVARSRGDRDPLGQRERHHEAVVVVGVLADQVDPTRRGPDPVRLLASPSYGRLDAEASASLLTSTHCTSQSADHIGRPLEVRHAGGLRRPVGRRDAPLDALGVGEIEPPTVPEGWVRVRRAGRCANHHDVWSLRGVGLPADRLPMILGCDAAGVTDDGREVIVHARDQRSADFAGIRRHLRPAAVAAVRALSRARLADTGLGARRPTWSTSRPS